MAHKRVESDIETKSLIEIDILEKLANALNNSPEDIQSLPMGDVLKQLRKMGINPTAETAAIEDKIKIIRGKIESVEVYEVTESELDILEKGSPSSLLLNFSIFLISVATSFLVSLLTTSIPTDRIFTLFVTVTMIGYIAGVVLLALWFVSYKSIHKLSKEIRRRLPPRDESE